MLMALERRVRRLMDLNVLRRIAERGLRRAQEQENSEYVDLFQHMLDEIEYLETQELFDV